MKRPAELNQLLTDLEAEQPESSVITDKDSKLVVVFPEESDLIEFTPHEARLLLSGTEAVNRLYEALNFPEDTEIQLHGLDGVEPEVMESLDSWAESVDEM